MVTSLPAPMLVGSDKERSGLTRNFVLDTPLPP